MKSRATPTTSEPSPSSSSTFDRARFIASELDKLAAARDGVMRRELEQIVSTVLDYKDPFSDREVLLVAEYFPRLDMFGRRKVTPIDPDEARFTDPADALVVVHGVHAPDALQWAAEGEDTIIVLDDLSQVRTLLEARVRVDAVVLHRDGAWPVLAGTGVTAAKQRLMNAGFHVAGELAIASVCV